jgi:hypothetical protein
MATPFQNVDETRRAYHSGLSGKVIDARHRLAPERLGLADRKINFTTTKYIPPFDVTIRSSASGWNVDHPGTFDSTSGTWRFVLPAAQFADSFDMKFVLDGVFWMSGFDLHIDSIEETRDFADPQVHFAYQIEFKTDLWQPNHLITLRNSDDGWWRDIFGEYRNGQWSFLLDRDWYSNNLEAKLVLDQGLFMNGANLTLTSAQPIYKFTDADISFASTPTAFRHGYDNFTSVESFHEQSAIRSVGRETELFDVIVIGSGMGGGTLAESLSDRGARVLVLEAGGLRLPMHMYDLARSELNFVGRDQVGHFDHCGSPYFAPGVHFNLGGRSVYWSGIIPQMQDWEFRDVWPAAVRDYLTVANGSGLDGYDRAEAQMRKPVSQGDFQEEVVDHLNTELGANLIASDLPRSLHQPQIEEYRRTNGTYSTTDILLDSLGFTGRQGGDFLKVNLHHLAIELVKSGSQITGVVCEDLVGHARRTYQGRYIVLACGSIESPKLALHSELADPHSKIGIGLTDHPAYFYQIQHPLPKSGTYAWIGQTDKHAKVILRHKSASSTAHAYNIELLINPHFWDQRHADEQLWQRHFAHATDSKVELKFLFDSLLDDTNKIFIRGIGQKPVVHVAANPSAAGYKAEMVAIRNEVLQAVGVPAAELSTTWIDKEWSQGIYGTVHHAGGTLRMSDNHSGVVDETLKFEAYDNLYCCDVSVFPTIPAANPSLTLVALAQRLSDTLASALGLP